MTSTDNTVDRIWDEEPETIDEDTNAVERSDEIKKNYLLLRNYVQNILPMRGMLLKTSLNSLSEIDAGTFFLENFSHEEKIKAKSMFQMDIISGIMLYIEDLVVLSESFRRKILYHKLLDPSDKNQADVGRMIEEFFRSVNSFSAEDIGRILGYGNPGRLGFEDEERALVEKIMQKNIAELRRMFVQIGEFGSTHHPAFRRFKHGGAPLIPGAEVRRGDGILSRFDSHTPVLEGSDPFKDIILIPLSKDVLEGYRIIIGGIQTCLNDLVKNHLLCIERNLNGMIPTNSYSKDYLSEKEIKLYEKIINEFYDEHPSNVGDLRHFHFESKIKKEKIKWYIDLPDFLKECKRRAE